MPSEIEADELRGVIARCNQAINTAKAKITKANIQIATCRDNLKQIAEDADLKRKRRADMKAGDVVSLREYRDVMNIIEGSEDMVQTIQTDLATFLSAVHENEAEIKANEELRREAQAQLEVTARIIQFPVRR